MTIYSTDKAMQAVNAAKNAIVKKNTSEARRFAMLAVKNDPMLEDAWLVMAASASPHAAVEYLGKALEINPTSERAQKGMQWAVQRRVQFDQEQHTHINVKDVPTTQLVDAQSSPDATIQKAVSEYAITETAGKNDQTSEVEEISDELPGIVFPKIADHEYTLPRVSMLSWVMGVFLLGIGLVGIFILPPLLRGSAKNVSSTLPAGVFIKPTYTSTPTATFTPTPTPTNTPTPTATPTATNTPYPTDTPLPPVVVEEYYVYDPGELPNVKKKERWIDVDLSSQTVSAYEGKSSVNSFLVSTGTWQHPTVTGRFHVYVKYRYTDMAGPGYYLPDVPYTMYFYDGYGLHGTYWHSNFGTPMSHGCINLRTEDAAWLYNWASVGTLVSVHE